MSKIAIISQPDQGVLIDVSGCSTLREALEHLNSTLQVSDQFWHGMHVSINLGALTVTKEELKRIVLIAKAVGINPVGVYSTNDTTRDALRSSNIPLGAGKPMTLPTVAMDSANIQSAEVEDKVRSKNSPLATITMRVVDAVARRGAPKADLIDQESELEEVARSEADSDDYLEMSKSAFPHVKPKRKVTLDGKQIAEPAREQSQKEPADIDNTKHQATSKTAARIADSVAAESTCASANAHESTSERESIDIEKRIEMPADVAKTVEMSVLTEENLPQAPMECEVVAGSDETPAAAKSQPSGAISRDAQAVSERVEARATAPETVAQQPIDVHFVDAPQAVPLKSSHPEVTVMTIQVVDGMMEAQPAQKALAQATMTGDVVTQADLECKSDAEVINPTVDDIIENAEEYDIEEELETDDSLDVETPAYSGPTTLYLRQNLRSGQTVSHKGHLVIIGDINPGAEVMADGDITVWGCLRGVAHAGIGGNVNAEIRALKLQPIQIRIAHAIARSPDRPRVNYAVTNGPETARMVDGKIKVVRSRLD